MEEQEKVSFEELQKAIAQIQKEMEKTLEKYDSDDNEAVSLTINDIITTQEESVKAAPTPTIEQADDNTESVDIGEQDDSTIEFEEQSVTKNFPIENDDPREPADSSEDSISSFVDLDSQSDEKETDESDEGLDELISDSYAPKQIISPLSQGQTILERVQDEIRKAVVGYDGVVENLLIAMLSGGHVLLEGYPGIAKTTLAKTFTSVLGLSYSRIQFTPDMLPQDITGHSFYNQRSCEFELRTGPIFSNLLLADEINRSTPKTQSALLEAMQESQVTIEGQTMKLPSPFMVIATTNPLEHEGVYALPIAQSDRFMFKIKMFYLPEEEEVEILKLKMNPVSIPDLEVIPLSELSSKYADTYVDESILHYITDIIRATRTSELLSVGASPRAAEQLLYASRARAVLRGRDYVIPDDVKHVSFLVLNHKILPSPEAGSEDVIVEVIIRKILDTVPVPLKKGNSE